MKIAILGTKGIPNNYGGFEQFAEDLSTQLVRKGHSVTVYNPSFHPYSQSDFKGVKIKVIYSPENILGGAANFIYDHLCLQDALKSGYDIIYEAGYHSVALSYIYFNIRKIKTPVILTNMDGLEWKRSKWSPLTRKFIKFLERKAVQHSPYLVSDNKGIQNYYRENFKKESFYIPYGANPITEIDGEILNTYALKKYDYNLIIARLEPENNIQMILDAHMASKEIIPLIIIGNHNTKYGKYLKERYQHAGIRFVGGIYNKEHLDSIRHFSFAYFHGHSVGGTNPSLLEAMASECFILAHDNPFNKGVLGPDAIYFSSSEVLAKILTQMKEVRGEHFEKFIEANNNKITNTYNWSKITDQHEELFNSLV